MRTRFYTQFISLFIILQLAFAPFVVVYAEETGSGDSFGGYGSLVGCKNSTARQAGGVLGSISGLFTKKANTSDPAKKETNKAIKSDTSGSVSNVVTDPVPVRDESSASTAASSAETTKNTAKTLDLEEKKNTREECLNGLAYRVAKFALAKLTEKTVNWINSGFNGDPFFIRDPRSYLESIKDQEINSILGPISKFSDSEKYPYGRDFARSFLKNRVSDYNDRSKSNLNSYLKENMTPAQYARNFSGGGWDGWLGLTQNPANNPLGFGMLTSQEIADRQARSTQETLNELNWGDGFLGQKKCAEPKDYIPAKSKDKPCKRWETVTPGQTISTRLSKIMNTDTDQLVMADQINESMSLVFDALINQAMVSGVSKLSTKTNNAYTTFGGPGSNRVYSSTGEDITNTTSGGYGQNGTMNPSGSSGWFNQDEEFDITGVKSANNLSWILGRQRLYKIKLSETIETVPGIIPAVGELDYCIPGPNPNWTTDVEYKLANIDELQARGINLSDPEFKKMSGAWGVAGNALVVAGGILAASGVGAPIGLAVAAVGLAINAVSGWISSKKQDEYEANKTIVENIQTAEENLQNNLLSETSGIDREEYKKYKTAIEKYYSKNIPIAEKALGITSNLNSYKESVPEAIDAYKQAINETTVNINELMDIKRQVDEIMNQQYVQDYIKQCGTTTRNFNDLNFGDLNSAGSGNTRPGGSGAQSGGLRDPGGFVRFPQ